MSNIISSDFFRVRRGAALRNTALAILGIVVLVLALMLVAQSGMMSDMAVPEGMTGSEVAEMQQEMQEVQADTASITGGASFSFEMIAQFFIPFFFLPIAIAVFCADFAAGTYRNTLSYESNRTKVYLAKLLLSLALSLALVLGMLLASSLLGGIAFGFADFTAAFFGRLVTTLLLQLPIYIAFVAVLHCIVAFTKKSSTAIAVFLVGYIALALLLQGLAGVIPGLDWLLMFDPQYSGRIMAAYDMVTTGEILAVLGYHTVIAVAATGLGLACYRKSDMP